MGLIKKYLLDNGFNKIDIETSNLYLKQVNKYDVIFVELDEQELMIKSVDINAGHNPYTVNNLSKLDALIYALSE